jgi:uncharacterized membrane protein YhaH (DUF805 family)
MNNPYQAPASNIYLADTGAAGPNSPFSTKGRFSRLSYIAWISIIGIAAQAFITLAIFGLADYSNTMMTGLVTALFQIPALIFHAIFTIRRSHDVGKSGWWVVLFLLPLVNFYLWVKRGDEGENNFGTQRPTTTAEKIIAYISITLIAVAIIGGVFAIIAFRQYLV